MEFFRRFLQRDEVTGVAFVCDYVELQFADKRMMIYGDFDISDLPVTISKRHPGVCELLIKLIGLCVERVSISNDFYIVDFGPHMTLRIVRLKGRGTEVLCLLSSDSFAEYY